MTAPEPAVLWPLVCPAFALRKRLSNARPPLGLRPMLALATATERVRCAGMATTPAAPVALLALRIALTAREPMLAQRVRMDIIAMAMEHAPRA
jgi:hypothetical protein